MGVVRVLVQRYRKRGLFALGLSSLIMTIWLNGVFFYGSLPALAQRSPATVEIAAALSLTGDAGIAGQVSLEGIQLAVEEANASGIAPSIKLTSYDDRSTDAGAEATARQIVASPAALVLGPVISSASLVSGPIFAEAGIVSLATTATADAITENPTTFRVIFKNSDQGALLATYLDRVLGQRQAIVIVEDTGYGRSLEIGFRQTATQLGIKAQYYTIQPGGNLASLTRQLVAQGGDRPIVLLMLDGDGARLLIQLRRAGVNPLVLGGDAFGEESFSQRFADQPEERQQPGYFTNHLYALSPIMLDSANADILAFAERFRQRFHHDPVWGAVASYDAAHLAIAALRTVMATSPSSPSLPSPSPPSPSLRSAVLTYLRSLNAPAKARPGLLAPFWFDQNRGRQPTIRVGQFADNRFRSAPLQIVPVTTPDPAEIASGAVFKLGRDRYGRLQRVVYTGVLINEITRVDLINSSFLADFYLWLRFAKQAGTGSADPTDLIFPTAIATNFDPSQPVERRTVDGNTEYWLWRVQGEFRNDYDFRLFPFDHQTLALPWFNARAAMERTVYVLDRSPARLPQATASHSSGLDNTIEIAAPGAFRNLSQWRPASVRSRRENLVTASALGDPTRIGAERQRELSGFLVTVELQRRVFATLTKSLLPLVVMTLIMYASLYFPIALVKEKVTVAVTAALSGAVLLTSINNQLGGIGYTMLVEYIFYVFFALSLLCIIAVLWSERLRAAHCKEAAERVDRSARISFPAIVAVTLMATVVVYWQGS